MYPNGFFLVISANFVILNFAGRMERMYLNPMPAGKRALLSMESSVLIVSVVTIFPR
jgi:hypothetical protein